MKMRVSMIHIFCLDLIALKYTNFCLESDLISGLFASVCRHWIIAIRKVSCTEMWNHIMSWLITSRGSFIWLIGGLPSFIIQGKNTTFELLQGRSASQENFTICCLILLIQNFVVVINDEVWLEVFLLLFEHRSL